MNETCAVGWFARALIRRGTCHLSRAVARGSIAFVWLMFLPAVSSGQATTLSELSKDVKKGETIEVTIDGRRSRGAFDSISSDALTVDSGGRKIRYAAERVQRVRHIDSPREGMLIGFAGGLTAGFVVALRMSPDPQRCLAGPPGLVNQLEGCGDDRNSAFASLVVAGYLAGTIIDSLMKKTLYVSPHGAASVSVAPVLRPGQQGLAVAVRFWSPLPSPATVRQL